MTDSASRGGRGLCKACAHPQLVQIEAELVAGRPLRTMAREYGMTAAALSRHQANHVSPSLVALKGVTVSAPAGATPNAMTVETLMARAEVLLEAAERDGRGSQALAAINQLTRLWELWQKSQVPEPVAVDILNSEEWAGPNGIRTRIMRALEPFPEARQAVADAL